MPYSTFGIFQNTPAIYAFVPSKLQKRRTATNIMAGCFDPLPMLPSHYEKETTSSSRVPSVTPMEMDEPISTVPARAISRKPKIAVAKRLRQEQIMNGAVKGKRVLPEEKENAAAAVIADIDSIESLSSLPPSPSPEAVHVEPSATELPSSKPPASGFWLARSANTSVTPVPPSLKRKRSSVTRDDDKSMTNAVETELSTKRSRPPIQKFRSPPPSSTPSLVSKTPEFTKSAPELTKLTSELQKPGTEVSKPTPELPKPIPTPEPPKLQTEKTSYPLLLSGDAKRLYRSTPEGTWRCRICEKAFSAEKYIMLHLKNKHNNLIDLRNVHINIKRAPPKLDSREPPASPSPPAVAPPRGPVTPRVSLPLLAPAPPPGTASAPAPISKPMPLPPKVPILPKAVAPPALPKVPAPLQVTAPAPPQTPTTLPSPPASLSAPAPTVPYSPPTGRTRAPRKNVAIKKGWKGWVEEELEPQKLILLDRPEVLPQRTTRSGRRID